MTPSAFLNPYAHGFARVAVAIPRVHVANPAANAAEAITLLHAAAERHVAVCAFPELGLTAYTCDDLFHQQPLLDGALAALHTIVQASENLPTIAVVGLPLRVEGLLFNVAAVVAQGRIRGIVPKTYLPNYREFYELRQFTPGDTATRDSVDVLEERGVPFGSRLVFAADGVPGLRFHVEICEDLWAVVPPSSLGALGGATVLVNLSASNALVGKHEYRRSLASNQSARCLAAYVYSAAGPGESTTDLAWDAHGMVHENGTLLVESSRYAQDGQLITADIDLDRIEQERMRQNTFGEGLARHAGEVAAFRRVEIASPTFTDKPVRLERSYARFPFVPDDPTTRDERCREVFDIQVHGLVQRLRSMRADKVVIGVSGGLDSTQALLVCAKAMDLLGRARSNILAYTMPGFATSNRTLDQARRLMDSVGATSTEIDIRPSCRQMLADIGHPFATGEPVYDVTFENVQAGERTSHLFRLANLHNAPVVGTSDLSEIALGWCTYGVGDHMAHYHVNASVPKTLIQHLIRYVARTEGNDVLLDVLDTEISPELVPDTDGTNEKPTQSSEATIGPYELQDFHIYYTVRYGYRPTKVAFLAWNAWNEKYPLGEVKQWLGVLLKRFFQTTQYKRTAMPNAPKVGSGGSLSPRGDWRAPSDSTWTAWEHDWATIPDTAP